MNSVALTDHDPRAVLASLIREDGTRWGRSTSTVAMGRRQGDPQCARTTEPLHDKTARRFEDDRPRWHRSHRAAHPSPARIEVLRARRRSRTRSALARFHSRLRDADRLPSGSARLHCEPSRCAGSGCDAGSPRR